jgi:hypothetical protein
MNRDPSRGLIGKGKTHGVLVVVLVCCLLLSSHLSALAQPVPELINYQGRLTDADGVGQKFDNPPKMEFNIYDGATAGNKIWGPLIFPSVPVVDGYFNVILGPTDQATPKNRSIYSAFIAKDRYLGITVNNNVEIAPRQQILSAPYAVQALHGVPPGTMSAFAGANVPVGWLLCDGSAKKSTDYPALFAAISTAWGNGSNDADAETNFNLPDLRGRFVRGVDGGAVRDPDRGGRTAPLTGGNSGDKVGSIQTGATKMPSSVFNIPSGGEHKHQWRGYYVVPGSSTSYPRDVRSIHYTDSQPLQDVTLTDGAHSHAIQGGDSETRPINANVNWIIKY